MNKNIKNNNKGISLVELVIVITIMAILTGVLTPMMIKYIEKAKKVRVETEASVFMQASRVAYVDACAQGKEPQSDDAIKNKTVPESPYYKNGTSYGNVTNWTVINGVVEGNSNATYGELLFENLGIPIGGGIEWRNGNSSIPISSVGTKDVNNGGLLGSMTDECRFQIFYSQSGDMIVEYSRNGYFVRMENSVIVKSEKVNPTKEYFTKWQ